MFSITFETKQNIKVARFCGDLTSDNMKIIKEELIINEEGIPNLIFDLQKLETIDSTGLGYIINCLKSSIKNNTEIKLLNLKNQPKIIFEITRVDSLFKIYNSELEALNSFINMEYYDESFNTNIQKSI